MRLGARLAADYLDGWFREDPLLPQVMALEAGDVAVSRIDAAQSPMRPDYRARFFEAPGLGGKLAVLASGGAARLIINLYRADLQDWRPPEAMLSILGRLALLHVAGGSSGDVPEALMALSER